MSSYKIGPKWASKIENQLQKHNILDEILPLDESYIGCMKP